MRRPIQYALTWRIAGGCIPIGRNGSPPDFAAGHGSSVYRPCLSAIAEALLLCQCADEIAVAAFLAGQIPFTGIPRLIAEALNARESHSAADSVDAILEADSWARAFARDWVKVTSR
jgi:1-deoxy-D-xylulose-5-phosphate reductoisomerase